MPIHWKDVSTIKPERFHIRSVPQLLGKSKPWADYERAARSLSEAIEKVISPRRKTGPKK
jgi:bifunctional non-homologous end joining protein LigD